MDESKVKELVNRDLPWFRWALQIQDWTIDVQLTSLDNAGNCKPEPDYKRARIEFCPGNIDNERELQEVLLHELLHILHAQLELFRRAAFQHVCDQHSEDALDTVWTNGCESLVNRLETMLQYGLGLTPAKLMNQSERHQRKVEKERSQ